MRTIISNKVDLSLEVTFLIFILLDTFLLFISIFLPLRPAAFQGIVLIDLFTSILLIMGYLLKMRNRDKKSFAKTHWNGFISVTPFYFIGIDLLGMRTDSIILKVLVFIKLGALLLSSSQVAKSVDEFVEKSKLIYGFSFFIVVLLSCSITFFLVESTVNPEVTNYEDSLWYVVQTITTVGYGDVVPITGYGRLIGVIAMVSAIGISSLLTAATTSSLMDKLRVDREKATKKSLEYAKKLEFKVNEIENLMARNEHLEKMENDVQEIKNELAELKQILEKK